MKISEIIEKLKQFSFDYENVPSYNDYYSNSKTRNDFDQRVLKYCFETKGKGEIFDHIFEHIQKKIWKLPIFESESISNENSLNDLVYSLWKPLSIQSLSPGMAVDQVIIDKKTDNIIGISIKKNLVIDEFFPLEDGTFLCKMADGSIAINNLESPNRKISVFFFTEKNAAEKGIAWITMSSHRIRGYREYKGFYIDLRGDNPIDRFL